MNGNRVLFIGNSHTYFNDMPALFADFCEAGTGERPFVTMLSHPGKTWEWHLQEYKEIRFNLLYGGYDYCVLQQAAHPFPGKEATLRDGHILAKLCQKSGTRPVISMTWAEKAYPEHQQVMADTYRQLAGEAGALLSPVGEIWQKVQKRCPEIELYASDGKHASVYGDYLIAAVHYSVLTGNSPVGLPSVGRDFMNGENNQDDAGKTKTVLLPVQCRKIQEIVAGELLL